MGKEKFENNSLLKKITKSEEKKYTHVIDFF